MAEKRTRPEVPVALVAAVNIIGPDGELVFAGQAIPTSWPKDFVKSLVATGGAVEAD